MPPPKTGLKIRITEYWRWLSLGERDLWKFTGALVLLAAIAPPVYFGSKPLLKNWRHHQALTQAARFDEQKDYRNMLLALQRATQIKPGDIGTWRRVATALDELNSSEAVVARENIAQLAPHDVSARLAVVAAALRFGQTERARETLDTVNSTPAHAEEFHRLAAALALSLGHETELAAHLESLIALNPGDTEARYNLAVVNLWSPDAARQREALAVLEALTADKTMRVRAALELLKHAARSRDSERVGAVTQLLIQRLPPPSLRDPLPGATPQWNMLVGGLKVAAAQEIPADVVLVARWLGSIRLASEAMLWVARLPDALRDAPAVRDVAAELAAQANEPARLRDLLLAGAWGAISPISVNQAIAAHAETSVARKHSLWLEAVRASEQSPAGLQSLSRLAQLWREPEANEAALRTYLQLRPKATWAYGALRTTYLSTGDSPKLLQLYETWSRQQPDNTDLAAAWIQLGAVLDRVTPAMREKAAELFQREPANLEIAKSQAAVLYRAGHYPEALAALRPLPPAVRATPPVALWITLAQLANKETVEFPAMLRLDTPSGLDAASDELLRTATRRAESHP